MNRERVRQVVLGLTLAMLALGLGACGEDAAPVVQPPPPPAPPPFQPQPVEVALGESGSTVTLMTTQGGGFTRNGEAYTGGDVEADNGNSYTLALADGSWTATFVPVVVDVALGLSGDTVTVTMLEDRSYEAGGEALMDGDQRSASNGNVYSLMMADGAWAAMYEPALVSVDLGTSGGSVTLSRAEDDTYSVAGGDMVTSVATNADGVPMGALAENGNMYTLSMVDGMWMAMFDAPDPVSVGLGTSGDSVSLQRAEDGTYWLGDAEVMNGSMTMADNGNEYSLSMADGAWMASYVPAEQMVTLGTTGQMITLVKAEDHSYWLGDAGIMDGSMTMADNGNTYSLAMGADGAWMATWVQDDPVVHMLGTSGATISLQRLEDRSWVRVGVSGISGLAADDSAGTIAVTASNGNVYHLMLMDGEYGEAMFQAPAPVMVMLGASGESVSIQKAENGTYWLGDREVMSGSTLMSSDGREYTLAYAADGWMASFDAPMVDVMLGNSGQTASLVRAEDGTYWLGDAPVTDGETTATASDGRTYRLSMGEDGMWMGTYVPATQTVMVGLSGVTITAVQDEAGQWSFTHPLTGESVALNNGMNYMVGNRTYMASMGEDGVWSATYVAAEVMVALGSSGEMVTLVVAEDGSYWLGDALVTSGETMATSGVGVMYTLTMGEDGMWSAAAVGNQVMVTLGTSGNATLTLAEDGTWWHGSDGVASGSTIAAANGNMYTITLAEDGSWSADYVAAEMAVMGTDLVALANENGSGYTVDGAALPATGNGNVTTMDGAMYRVQMEDGMLKGARYEAAIKTDSDGQMGLSALPTLVGDTYGTAANEAATMLTVNGENFSVGDLLGGGMSGLSGKNIVKDALAEITKLSNRAKAYEELNVQLDNETQDAAIVELWNDTALQTQINRIFGTDGNTQSGTANFDLTPTDATSADTVLEDFAKLITALSSADAFVAATAEEGDGILEGAATAENAMKYFDANESESMTYYRTTENTRYGAYHRTVRRSVADDATALTSANQDLNFDDAADTTADIGDHGVFSWGVGIPDTVNRSHLPPSGTLHYSGGTLAVATGDNNDSPMVYEGTIDIQLSLTRDSISGIVSDLMDMDQNPLVMNFAEVDHIVLPSVSRSRQSCPGPALLCRRRAAAAQTLQQTRPRCSTASCRARAARVPRCRGRGAGSCSEPGIRWRPRLSATGGSPRPTPTTRTR